MSKLGDLIRAWRDPDFPYRRGSDPMPYLVHTMFWVGVWMPVGAICFVVLKLLLGDGLTLTLEGQEITSHDLLGAGGVAPLTVALVGIALAYGIWAERSYPRYLAIAVIVAGAGWMNIRMIQTLHVSWEPIGAAIAAVGSVRYLARNPDVVDYYSRRQRRRFRTDLTPAA